jgi:hypothetical protein
MEHADHIAVHAAWLEREFRPIHSSLLQESLLTTKMAHAKLPRFEARLEDACRAIEALIDDFEVRIIVFFFSE